MAARSLRYASEFTTSGYSVAARRCIAAMISAGVDVAWEPLHDVPVLGRVRASVATDAPSFMRSRRSMPSPGENLVLHCVPRTWNTLIADLSPGHVIGHTVWECETISSSWIHQMKGVHEFWVPTQWNQVVFEETFRKRAHVIPHAVSGDVPDAPPLALDSDRFLFVAVSAWDWRKRPDRVVEAYLNAFTAADPVQLVIKTTPRIVGWDTTSGDPVAQIMRIVSRYPNPAPVHIDTTEWSDAQILGLLHRADCFVSMTASEGWGLGAFDAACGGTPILITGWGGQVEWLGTGYPGLLPYSMVENDHPDREVFEAGMKWAYPEMAGTVDMLRAVAEGRFTDLTNAASSLAPVLRERYSSDVVGRAVVDALEQVEDRSLSVVASIKERVRSNESVVIMTPVKNAARHASGYVDRILSLERPSGGLRVAILASDSDDGTVDAFEQEFQRLRSAGIEARILQKDFGYRIPEGVPRWDPSVQLERRRVLALSRNHLLFSALGNEDWVLWLDVDVVSYPADLLKTLIGASADIVQPDCVREPGGPSFDLNAWTDRGRWHLHDYRDSDRVELHAVGGTVLLVRADRHRDGLVWPAFLYGNDNPRKRLTSEQLGRDEIGEIETEGLALMAHDMGIACIGLPRTQVVHE